MEIAVKWMVAEHVFLQAGSLKDTHTHYISVLYTACAHHNKGNCSELYWAGGCFLWEGQVVSRKAEVNLRLSGPAADWSQTGMWLTDFLRDPLGPSGMLLSFGTSLFYNLCLTRLAPLTPRIVECICDVMKLRASLIITFFPDVFYPILILRWGLNAALPFTAHKCTGSTFS